MTSPLRGEQSKCLAAVKEDQGKNPKHPKANQLKGVDPKGACGVTKGAKPMQYGA